MTMDQAIAERLEALTDQKPRKRGNKAPRNGGKFQTSEAKKRRQAAGIEPEKASKGGLAAGVAAIIADIEPAVPTETRTEVARNIASAMTVTKGLTIGLIEKIQQGLKKSEGMRELIDGVPDTARYLVALVRGKDKDNQIITALHSDRLTAARMILDYAGIATIAAQDDRDPSEISLDELYHKVMQIDHKIDVATSLPGESERIEAEVGNAAPLHTVSRETSETTLPAQRQAIE